jgi:ribonucleoside-diphosphate reductase beta chain
MDMISIQGKTNFFEKRVGEYQKAGVLSKQGEQKFDTEVEF